MATIAVHLKDGDTVNLEPAEDFSIFDPEEDQASNTRRRNKAFASVRAGFAPQELVEDQKLVAQFDPEYPFVQGYSADSDAFVVIPAVNVSYVEIKEA